MNSYYNHSTTPATSSSGSSALIRAEYDAVSAGFALLPQLSSGNGFVWRTNAGGTSGEAVALATLINGAYLPTAGGTMTGDLNMGSQHITGVANIGGFSDAGAYSIWGGLTSLNGGTIQLFGNSNSGNPGQVALVTSGVSRLAIDNAGNSTFTGLLAAAAGLVVTTSGSTSGLAVTDTGTNGANIKLTGSSGGGTPKKYIRATGGLFQIINDAYSATILSLTDAGALTVPGSVTGVGLASSAGAAIGGALTGATTGAFSGLITASGGVTFDGANTLSTFVQGALTLNVSGSSSGAAGGVTGVGKYMRVGNLVTIQLDLNWTSQGTALGNAVVLNMPYAGNGVLQTLSCLITGSSTGPNSAYILNGTTTLVIAAGGAAQGNVTWTQLGAGTGSLSIWGSYFA